MIHLLIFTLFSIPFFYAANTLAHEHREHGPHVHGQAQLSIAIEKDEIEAELNIPGNDLVGFEHEAQNKAETQRLNQVSNRLQNQYELLNMPAPAHCRITERRLNSEKHAGEGHVDYDYDVKFKCQNMNAVESASTNLFKDFKTLHEVKIELVTDQGQSSQVLAPQKAVILLKLSGLK